MANRVTQQAVEALVIGTPAARVTQQAVEALVIGTPAARATQIAVEILQSNVNLGPIDMLGLDNSQLGNLILAIGAGRIPVEKSVSSTLSLSHSALVSKKPNLSVEHTLGLSATLGVDLTINRTVSQGLPVTGTATRTISRVLSTTSALSLSQSATYTLTKLTSSALVLTQNATYVTGKHVRQSFEMTQVVGVSPVYLRSLFSVLIPYQTIGLNTYLTKPISQTLSLTQTVVGHRVKSAVSSLVLTQSVTGVLTKPVSNALAMTQNVSVNRAVNKTVSHSVNLVQTLVIKKSYAAQAVSYLGFNQFARGTKRLTQSAASSLTLSQDLVRDRTIEDLDHSLTLVQTAQGMKIAPRAVSTSLAMTQSVAVSTTLVRGITQTLTFLNSHQVPTGIAGHDTVDVPNVQGVLIKHGTCLVILQNGNLAIVLPCPEFGDSEGGTGSINIKRTMAGGRRVYKKGSTASKLSYQFIIDRKKAIELRNFILQSNTAFLRMENWKGELWAVQMVNNPFSFGEDAAWLNSTGGNRSSITLEFQGVRLN